MNDYQPKPGETVLLTMHALVGDDGMLVIDRAPTADLPALMWPGARSIVSIEPLPKPSLPTAFGSRIVADIDGRVDVELVLASPTSKQMRWFALDGEWINEGDLSNARVLHDADVPKPTAEVAAPMTEDEPMEMPTKFGAVVLAMYDGEIGLAVRSDPRSPVPWFVLLPRCRNRWASDGELTCTAVLSPGVEVDLP